MIVCILFCSTCASPLRRFLDFFLLVPSLVALAILSVGAAFASSSADFSYFLIVIFSINAPEVKLGFTLFLI